MARKNVSLMIMMPETPEKSVHDLPRVTLQGRAAVLQRGSNEWQVSKTAYLSRYPDVEHMTELGDFQFVAIEIQSARHVAGFGAARTVDFEELNQVLCS
jgi:putative heme iron utilization protein